jgi:hypothetical protein
MIDKGGEYLDFLTVWAFEGLCSIVIITIVYELIKHYAMKAYGGMDV